MTDSYFVSWGSLTRSGDWFKWLGIKFLQERGEEDSRTEKALEVLSESVKGQLEQKDPRQEKSSANKRLFFFSLCEKSERLDSKTFSTDGQRNEFLHRSLEETVPKMEGIQIKSGKEGLEFLAKGEEKVRRDKDLRGLVFLRVHLEVIN